MKRRIPGRCYYCGARTKALTCLSCRPLQANDPLLEPGAATQDALDLHPRQSAFDLAYMQRRAERATRS